MLLIFYETIKFYDTLHVCTNYTYVLLKLSNTFLMKINGNLSSMFHRFIIVIQLPFITDKMELVFFIIM